MNSPKPDNQEIEVTISSGVPVAPSQQQDLQESLGKAFGWVSASNRREDGAGNWSYDQGNVGGRVQRQTLTISADGRTVRLHRVALPVTDPQSAGAFSFDDFSKSLIGLVRHVANAPPEASECHLRIRVSNLREKKLINFNPQSLSGRRALQGPQPEFAPAAHDPVEYSEGFLSDASGVRDELLSATRYVLRQFEPSVAWQNDEFDFEFANL
ncbi:MAG TPA: hypothetical protein VG206_24675 [Terriglobia bacterium]|nr:hypothetical protein [Terriglobia bacterium]